MPAPIETRSTGQQRHLDTLEDLTRRHGAPSAMNGSTGVGAGEDARRAADAHLAEAQLIRQRASWRSDGNPMPASTLRQIESHESQHQELLRLAEQYEGYGERYYREQRPEQQQRADRYEAHMAATGQTGSEREGRFHTSGGLTYRQGDPQTNWMKDLIAFGMHRDADAADRLRRNNREVFTEHRALSTTDGAGGDFVPPLYMVNQYVELARAQRVTANLVQKLPLPSGTDSLKIPKMLTGTAVAEQAVQNTAVQNTDASTGTITADVATLAGQQVLALQLIEQSPVDVGDMILRDLLGDLAAKINLFVLTNNATNKKGLLQVTGTNPITYTSGSPTPSLLFNKLADARNQIETGRFATPTAIVMHPRRWAYLLGATDANGRPLVVPSASGPHNALGNDTGPGTDGRVGTMIGLPVYVDPLLPTNLGAGTNQDPVLVLKADDSQLFESVPRAESFREPRADSLGVLVRVYQYLAFTAERQPKSVSVITGTGLVAPTF